MELCKICGSELQIVAVKEFCEVCGGELVVTAKKICNQHKDEYRAPGRLFRRIFKNESGEIYRKNGPAIEMFYSDGSKWIDVFVNDEGRLQVMYYPDGKIREKVFYFKKETLTIQYYQNGSIKLVEWMDWPCT